MGLTTLAGAAAVGTSGFSYPSWRGGFYPEKAKAADFLHLYAERLPAVELNATFYQLPAEERLQGWAAATPEGFRFAVKVSRRISHFGQLDLLPTFCERVLALGDRLGPLLLQFPPSRPRDDGLLRLLLDSLDPGLRVAFEFRNETWLGPEVDAALAGAGAVRVNALEGAAPFRYLRLREPPYSEEQLVELAARLRTDLDAGRDVHAFFKHEDDPRGAHFALRLLELLEGQDGI